MYAKFATAIKVAAAAVFMGALLSAAATPRITGIAPSSPVAGPSAQQLTITGEGFMRGLTLTAMSPAGQSQVYKDMDVQSQEDASFRVSVPLTTAGAWNFTVTNTDGGVSQPFRLDVVLAAPAASSPVITSLTPEKGAKQSQPQTIHVEGKRFVAGLTVHISDPAGNVINVGGGSITNQTENAFDMSLTLTVEGEYNVTVTNPGGQVSNAVNLSVR